MDTPFRLVEADFTSGGRMLACRNNKSVRSDSTHQKPRVWAARLYEGGSGGPPGATRLSAGVAAGSRGCAAGPSSPPTPVPGPQHTGDPDLRGCFVPGWVPVRTVALPKKLGIEFGLRRRSP